jgi:HK97 family phage prohead protease
MNQDNNTENELRARYGDNVEVRAVEVRAQEDMTIEGYASVFGDEYDLGYFTERVAPGAFDGRTNDDVRLLINHTGVPLARTTNNTLTLTIDERGLHYRAKLADTQEGRDLYTLIQRGDITQSSFAFTIEDDEWSGDRRTRTINRVGQLYDVSPVTYPASPTTTVQAREMATYTQPEPAPAPVEEPQPEIVATPIFERKSDKFQTMNLNDMKALRANKISQLTALNEGATLQASGYTEGEEVTIDALNADIAELDAKIERAEKVEAQVARAAFGSAPSKSEVVEQSKLQERYSFSKLVRESMTGLLTGLEAEMSQQAAKELKDSGVGIRGLAQIPGFLMRATSTIGGTNVTVLVTNTVSAPSTSSATNTNTDTNTVTTGGRRLLNAVSPKLLVKLAINVFDFILRNVIVYN